VRCRIFPEIRGWRSSAGTHRGAHIGGHVHNVVIPGTPRLMFEWNQPRALLVVPMSIWGACWSRILPLRGLGIMGFAMVVNLLCASGCTLHHLSEIL
jgi:hypothetical protein